MLLDLCLLGDPDLAAEMVSRGLFPVIARRRSTRGRIVVRIFVIVNSRIRLIYLAAKMLRNMCMKERRDADKMN